MLFGPKMLGLVEALLGPEAYLFNDQVTGKPHEILCSDLIRHQACWALDAALYSHGVMH